jgi:hypothetical protein
MIFIMDVTIQRYLSKIGRRGGRKSRRKHPVKTAKDMVRIREAQKAFRDFHTQCFWSHDLNYRISIDDVQWVAEMLMKNGGRKAWEVGSRLCR